MANIGAASLADRRRSDRVPVVVRVDYSTVDAFFSDFTANINEGGIFIETEDPPPPGTSVSLQFQLPGGDEPVRVTGTVVWSTGGGPEEHPGIGIEFEDLDDTARARINDVVRKLRVDEPGRTPRGPGA